MRENLFNDLNSIYLIIVRLQSESLKLGNPHQSDEIEPWRRLIDDAFARINQIQSKQIDDKVRYKLQEMLGTI